MYDINAGNARPQMAEVGRGSDQVFDFKPVERAFELDAARKQKQDEEKQAKQAAHQKALSDSIAAMQGKAIMSHDTEGIANQQKELRDYAIANIDAYNKGDIGVQLALDQKIANLNQNVNSSVVKRQNVEKIVKELQDHPENFTKESRRNIEKFIYEGGMKDGLVQPFNEGELVKPSTDLSKEIPAIRAELQATAPKTSVRYTAPDGSESYRETYNTSDNDVLENPKDPNSRVIQKGVITTLRNAYITNERIRNKANEMLAESDDVTKAKYTTPDGKLDAAKYFADTFSPEVSHRESKVENKAAQLTAEQKNGDTQNDIIDTKPSSYKMISPSTEGEKEATATSVANARLNKTLSKDLPITTDLRDINGNKLPNIKGVYPVSGNDMRVMPVYKDGTKSEGGKADLGGNVVPDERMDNAIKTGTVEYKPMFLGVMKVPDVDTDGVTNTYTNAQGVEVPLKKDISIVVPAHTLRGGLGKSEKTIDDLNKIAEQKNSELGGKTKSAPKELTGKSNSGKDIISTDGGKTWQYK